MKTKIIYSLVFQFLLLLAFIGCQEKNSPNAPEGENSPMLQKLVELGFRADMIEEHDDHFRVEKCIIISKDDLMDNLQKTTQARSQFLVSQNEIWQVSVKIDASMPSSGNDNWRTEIAQAIADWNAIPDSDINFHLTTSSYPDITIISDNGILENGYIADAKFPSSSGNAGWRIRVNLGFNNNMNVATGVKRRNIVHELGHCIGFYHTNWATIHPQFPGDHIDGTPTTDGSSVMNGGTALDTWSGFSYWDKKAAKILYPIIQPPVSSITWTGYTSSGGHPLINWGHAPSVDRYIIYRKHETDQNFSPIGATTNNWYLDQGVDIRTYYQGSEMLYYIKAYFTTTHLTVTSNRNLTVYQALRNGQ